MHLYATKKYINKIIQDHPWIIREICLETFTFCLFIYITLKLFI